MGDEPFFFATSLLFERCPSAGDLGLRLGRAVKYSSRPTRNSCCHSIRSRRLLSGQPVRRIPAPRATSTTGSTARKSGLSERVSHLPVVDQWAYRIQATCCCITPGFDVSTQNCQYIPRWTSITPGRIGRKGFVRTVRRSAKPCSDSTSLPWLIVARSCWAAGKDPLRYVQLLNILQQRLLPVDLFVLLGDYGEYDRNVSPYRRAFQSLIKSLADYNRCGIHPFVSFGWGCGNVFGSRKDGCGR